MIQLPMPHTSRTCDYRLVDNAIQAFLAEARSYCLLVESNESPNSWMFAHVCLSQLLRLYETALHLPDQEPETANSFTAVSHEAWDSMRRDIGRRLARDNYWEVFEPLEEEQPEAIVGSLSDDLADIWRDLKPSLADLDGRMAISIEDTVWKWRFSFESHWGHHAACAIGALHALCFGVFADGSRPETAPRGS
jgi:hypothetical protein